MKIKLELLYGAVILLCLVGLCVSIPLAMPAVMAAKLIPLPTGTERTLLSITGVGLPLMLTLGGAIVGAAIHVAPVSDTQRKVFFGVWLYALASVVFLSTGNLLSKYTGEPLDVVLSGKWLLENLLLVAYMANMSLSSEVVLVVAIVAGAAIAGKFAEEKATTKEAAKVGGEEILTLLREKGELTAREIREATGLSEYQTNSRLKKLLARGLLQHDDGTPRRHSAVGAP